MSVITKFPTTMKDRLDFGRKEVYLPATWEEYVELAGETEFQIEYEDKHIILMSYATDPHEQIVANILGIFFQLLENKPDMIALGSNRHIYLEEFEADYAPDVSVRKGKPIDFVLRKGVTAYMNPRILFEVLSPSTASKDWNKKLPRYKTIPTVRQIIYIKQGTPFVSVFDRIDDSDRWENVDYTNLDQSFLVEGQAVTLDKIYRKVVFEEKD